MDYYNNTKLLDWEAKRRVAELRSMAGTRHERRENPQTEGFVERVLNGIAVAFETAARRPRRALEQA